MRNRQLEIGVALVLAFVLAACGASARKKVITATFVTANAASLKLAQVSEAEEAKIEARITSRELTYEAGRTQLDSLRAKVDKAFAAIAAVIHAVAAALLLEDKTSFENALQAGLLMKAALAEAGVRL